jgi:hypothetical protein
MTKNVELMSKFQEELEKERATIDAEYKTKKEAQPLKLKRNTRKILQNLPLKRQTLKQR